jgi:hypothetical protein
MPRSRFREMTGPSTTPISCGRPVSTSRGHGMLPRAMQAPIPTPGPIAVIPMPLSNQTRRMTMIAVGERIGHECVRRGGVSILVRDERAADQRVPWHAEG